MRRLSRGGDVRSRKDRKQARHSAVLTEAASSSSSSDADIKARFEKAAKYKARKGQKEDKSGDVNETMLPTAVDATTAKPGPTSEGGAVEYEQVKKTDEFDSLAPEIQTALRKKGAVQVAVETGSAVPESRRPGENEEVWEIASEIANERGIAVHSVPFEEVQQRMSTASVTDPRLQESALEATYKRGVADQLVEEKVEQAERAVAGGAEVSSLDAASSGASASVFDPTVLSVERIEELTPMQQSASTPGAVDTSSNAAADSLSAELQSYRQRKGAEVDTQTEQAAAALVAEGNQLLDAGRYVLSMCCSAFFFSHRWSYHIIVQHALLQCFPCFYRFQRARDVLRKACAICPGKVETGAQVRELNVALG